MVVVYIPRPFAARLAAFADATTALLNDQLPSEVTRRDAVSALQLVPHLRSLVVRGVLRPIPGLRSLHADLMASLAVASPTVRAALVAVELSKRLALAAAAALLHRNTPAG